MVTGIVPFDGDSTVTVALMHIRNQPIPPIDLNGRISPALNDVILRALSKSADDRYSSAHAMRVDLIRTLSNPNGTFAREPVAEMDKKPVRKKKKKRSVYLWITLAVTAPIVLLVLLFVFYLSQREEAVPDAANAATDVPATVAAELPDVGDGQSDAAEIVMPSLYGMSFDDALYRAHALGFTDISVMFVSESAEGSTDNTVVLQSVKRGTDVSGLSAVKLTVFRDDPGMFTADVAFTATVPQNGSVVQIVYQTANYNNISYNVILFEQTRNAQVDAEITAALNGYDAATRTVRLLINGEVMGEADARFVG